MSTALGREQASPDAEAQPVHENEEGPGGTTPPGADTPPKKARRSKFHDPALSSAAMQFRKSNSIAMFRCRIFP